MHIPKLLLVQSVRDLRFLEMAPADLGSADWMICGESIQDIAPVDECFR